MVFRFIALLSLSAALTLALGCVPTSNTLNPSGKKTSAATTVNSLSTLTGGGTSSDGARGQCVNIDSSRPERAYCNECYTKLLTSLCPGAQNPEACLDRAVATNFNQLVNQCISNSVVAGFACTRTCATGTTLNQNTCQCDPVATTGGSSGTSTGSTDSGQTNYGPPLVTVNWPASYTPSTNPAPGIAQACSSEIPVLFNVTNRGNSVPKLNIYTYQNSYPTTGTDAASNWLGSILDPVYLAQTSQVKSTFVVHNGTANWPGNNTGYGYLNDFLYFDDFEVVAPAAPRPLTLGNPAPNYAIAPNLSRIAGPFKQAEALTLSLSSGGAPFNAYLPTGRYLLNFDLLLFNDWQGTAAEHGFQITHSYVVVATGQTVSRVIFKDTFASTASDGQSFPGNATRKATRLGPPSTLPPYGDGLDAIYPVSLTFNHTCASGINSCPLALKFEGLKLLVREEGGEPYWGMDNLSLMPLREFAFKYTFTDTNQLTSAYCIWLEVFASCTNPMSTTAGTKKCTVWASSRRSATSGDIIAATFPDPTISCPTSSFPAAFPTIPRIYQAAEANRWGTWLPHPDTSTHTDAQCTVVGAPLIDTSSGWKYCLVDDVACPATWLQYTGVTTAAGKIACY